MLTQIALPLSKPILLHADRPADHGVGTSSSGRSWSSNPERYPACWPSCAWASSSPSTIPEQYAGYVIVGLPILILFAFTSRSFIRGLTSGAIKM